MGNLTEVKEFLLRGFSDILEILLLLVGLFLLIYLAALVLNLLIIMVITLDPCLHSPMCFFLKNLSFLYLCYISVTVPKSIYSSLTHSNSISDLGCVAQAYFFFVFGSAELAFLTVISYDCYVAICSPLQYRAIFTSGKCHQMSVITWLSCLSFVAVYPGNIFREPISRSNKIHHLFCDISHMLTLHSCESLFLEFVTLALSSCLIPGCFIMITSYFQIFSTVLRIPSIESPANVFSISSPQLIVLMLFLTTVLFAALGPISKASSIQGLILSMAYMVPPPFLNPIIYSLKRTKQLGGNCLESTTSWSILVEGMKKKKVRRAYLLYETHTQKRY